MAQTFSEKVQTLPNELRTLFFSDVPMLAGEEVAILYGLTKEKIPSITLPLGAILVGDMKLSDYPLDIAAKAGLEEGTALGIAYEMNRRIFLKFAGHFKDAEILQRDWEKKKKSPVMSEQEAKNKILELEPWLLTEVEDVPEEEEPQHTTATVKMPLLQALSQYEQLGNQLISEGRIKIKSQSEPVRPSLLYWIKYYRDELGIGHHDSVQRGNFLFRSENGKRLSAEERERVNLVLKSVEENFPLEIDTERSEIIFPVFQTSAPVRPSQSQTIPQIPSFQPQRPVVSVNPAFAFGKSSMAPSAPTPAMPASAPQGGEMSFSSKHVFPAEKTPQTAQAPQVTPTPIPRVTETPAPRMNQPTSVNAPTGTQTVPRANPFRIRPVSLGQNES